uniref:Putative ubiquinone oxidoreductase ndufb8/ashi subunit n=1 Tax=Ornithodoros turicata TaxID=34597 RepID=A0A2R5LFJ4_9ACAR
MAAVAGHLGRYVLFRDCFLRLNVARQAHYWNKDWRPATEVPDTAEKKKAAAQKYGLIPHDYKPYPEDNLKFHGDYPQLPEIGAESRDAFEPYDFPYLRRNYGEPLHIHADVYTVERIDNTTRKKYSHTNQVLTFLSVMGVLLGFFILGEKYPLPLCPQLGPKQLYKEGEVQYTFDPAE